LSFVKITPFNKNHMKILIFSGHFNFHNALLDGKCIWFTSFLYIDCTLNDPCLEREHLIESWWSSNCTNEILETSSFHLSNLSPTSALLKDILRGIELKALATDKCFSWWCYINMDTDLWEGHFQTIYPPRT
jgi:hypothetical protein